LEVLCHRDEFLPKPAADRLEYVLLFIIPSISQIIDASVQEFKKFVAL